MPSMMPPPAGATQPTRIPHTLIEAELDAGQPSMAVRAVTAMRREQLAQALAEGCRQIGGPPPSETERRVLAWLLDAPTPPSVWQIAGARAAISRAAAGPMPTEGA